MRFLPTLRLGWLSTRSFLRHPLTIAALCALTVIPLLYTGMYLWAFWDPFGKLSNLPVALVNEDEPATADGETVTAGDDLTDELVERGDLAWRVTDARDAAAGVADGRYYASVTIPEDFSADLVSPADTGNDPTRARLEVHYNDATNYIASELLAMGLTEIEKAVDESAVSRYLDAMFVGFNEIHSKTEEAADGAGQLADGASDAKDGSGRLYDGLGDAEDGAGEVAGGASDAEEGAGELADGAATAKDGADDLADGASTAENGAADLESGLGELHSGAADLADGAASASDRVNDKADEIDALADEWIPLLKEHSPEIEKDAGDVADAADALATALDELPEICHEETARLKAFKEDLDDPAKYPDIPPEVRDALKQGIDLALEADRYVEDHRDRIDGIADDARAVRDLAQELKDEAPHLADDAEDAREQVDELASGLEELASGSRELRDGLSGAEDGAADLHDGLGDLENGAGDLADGLGGLREGADELDSGLGDLASGAGSLDEGITELRIGAGDLDDGLGDLEDGSGELAGGLRDGAEEIPVFDEDSRSARDAMMSAPTRLASATSNPVPDYGTGFAPFFLGLSLWVGAMVVYMVLPTAPGRALASTAPSWRVAVAGWIPGLALGAAQAVVMVAALHLLLGLDAVHWPGLIAFLVLVAAAYTSIVHWVDAQFGAPGKVIVLVMLIVQIVSAGGTYPLQTSPGLLQAVAPYMPMYQAVTASRHLISGGDPQAVLHACLVLGAYTAAGLLLGWAAVAGKRTWTMSRLHPALEL
ncbi:YhgE/Pip domain-containing protein [Nocardiopsis sp. RSe5-2]|uniref:YhgE/Pip domain-containing protein n=1 Tax=Nocardiopsis endophytica TaxID=3018445 RepID=A0ABT4U1M6_9ACTN|nr:YhgE/Pip domain-containing protein [Nocardiopsis endophytica]MDA2810853.1 YhgE/Pip domain-containing protein [Nocardiopsis endophytica]